MARRTQRQSVCAFSFALLRFPSSLPRSLLHLLSRSHARRERESLSDIPLRNGTPLRLSRLLSDWLLTSENPGDACGSPADDRARGWRPLGTAAPRLGPSIAVTRDSAKRRARGEREREERRPRGRCHGSSPWFFLSSDARLPSSSSLRIHVQVRESSIQLALSLSPIRFLRVRSSALLLFFFAAAAAVLAVVFFLLLRGRPCRV